MESNEIINNKVAGISPSQTLAITSRAKQMAADGKEIFSFAAGEPDFDTPAHIKSAAEEALRAGETKYSPAVGLLTLRESISEKLKNDNGLTYKPKQVIVSNGGKHSLFNIFMAICNDGDEIIIPAPYWLSYPEMVRVAGGKVVPVYCREDNDFKLTPKELKKVITGKSKAIILNSPSNPIGVVYTGDEIRALAEVAVAHGLYIVSDEMYEKILYDGVEHVSVGSLSPEIFARTITVNGFSKAYSMTGWRLGYFAGPEEITKAVNALQSHSTSGPNTFAQFGAVAALRGSQECVSKMVAAFAERRAYLYGRLTGIEGITCVKPMGAFYMLPNISSFGMDSVSFAERLLEEEGVAVVPGKSFAAAGNVRLSYACSMDNIRGAMDRIEKFVAGI